MAATRLRRATGEPHPPLPEVVVRRHTYNARLLRSWDHWVVQVPEVHGVHAIVPDQHDARDVARQAIAIMLDMDPAAIRVVIEAPDAAARGAT